MSAQRKRRALLVDPGHPPSGLQSGLLLVALLLVIGSVFVRGEAGTWGGLVAGVFYIGVFSVAGYLIGARRRWLTAYLCLAGPAVLVSLVAASQAHPSPIVEGSRDLLGLILQVMLVGLVFRFSLFHRSASRLDRVIAGVCGYFILALIWANLYSLLEICQPGGLVQSSGAAIEGDGGSLLYFSLITLSTTGYGDILATSPAARLLASLEAVTGTLYLAVFISTLISGGGDKAARG
jgi:hypothetical protein